MDGMQTGTIFSCFGRQAIASSNQELAMKKTKIAWIIVMISVFALSSCGWFSGTGPRDGKGPRRDGTGFFVFLIRIPAIGSPVHPEKINWSVLQYNRLLPILLWAASHWARGVKFTDFHPCSSCLEKNPR